LVTEKSLAPSVSLTLVGLLLSGSVALFTKSKTAYSLLRVLTQDKYNEIMVMIKEGKIEKPKSSHNQHKHSG
jgi:uncharacterized protein (UPF0297 family)